MYIILTYDVHRKRVAKVLKTCRKYLVHVQKSVFEGHITPAKLSTLQKELANIIEPQTDSVQIYQLESPKYTKKIQIGVVESNDFIL